MSNFREMSEISTISGCLKKYQTHECEQIIYHFKARDLEIPNTYVHIYIFREVFKFCNLINERLNDFREIYYCTV